MIRKKGRPQATGKFRTREELEAEVMDYHLIGHSVSDIARWCKTSRCTVYGILQKEHDD